MLQLVERRVAELWGSVTTLRGSLPFIEGRLGGLWRSLTTL
jgi:hypothetical protein